MSDNHNLYPTIMVVYALVDPFHECRFTAILPDIGYVKGMALDCGLSGFCVLPYLLWSLHIHD